MKDIKGIAENNVELRVSEEQKDIDGNPFQVWGETVSYGQHRIDVEREAADEALKIAKAIDANQYKEDQIAKAIERLDTLNLIQDEMDKWK